jgi:hypothetical protein
MAGILDILGGIVSSVIPTWIYNPSTGAILGGAVGGGAAAPPSNAPSATVADPAQAYGPGGLAGGYGPLGYNLPTSPILYDGMGADIENVLAGQPPTATQMAFVGTLEQLKAGQSLTIPGAGTLARRALPTIAKVVASAVLLYGGEKLATSIYNLYANLRRSGHSHKRARRLAHQAHGVNFKRRRMRPTNVHALRRAIRRVHGFKRIARKVGALGVTSHGRFSHPRRHMRRARRGDVGPFMVEDYADMLDEAEDFDLEGESFSESAVGE